MNFKNCIVIHNKTGQWYKIDSDPNKPVYLKDGYPYYQPDELFNYHLGNLQDKEKPDDQIEGQMNIFDFLGEEQ